MTRLPQLGPRGEGWVVVQAILLALAALAGLLGPSWSGEIRLATSSIGVVLMVGGLAFVVLGVRHLQGRDALTPLPFPRDEAALVETGVYGVVRHPIYSGVIIGTAGWGLLTASPAALAMALGLFAFFDLKSRREETWLERRFPGYAAYRARTARLIPWLGGVRD
jgi:protein-S-isoprenylcysteine O-methyltransferase Ste14